MFKGGGANTCSKETAEFVKAYGKDIEMTKKFYQFLFKRPGRGVKGVLNNVKKVQDWYSEASLRLRATLSLTGVVGRKF